jgi:hypothetical protein
MVSQAALTSGTSESQNPEATNRQFKDFGFGKLCRICRLQPAPSGDT